VLTKEIAEAIEQLEGAKAEELVKKALNEGANPWEILQEGIVKGIKAVGDSLARESTSSSSFKRAPNWRRNCCPWSSRN